MLALTLGSAWVAAVILALLDGRRRWVGALSIGFLIVSLGIRIALLARVATGGALEMTTGGWPAEVGITLRADVIGGLFTVLSTGMLLAALGSEVVRGVRSRAFPAFIAFLDVGMTGLYLTGDAFNFYVFFEVAMAASFALASYGGRRRQIRAALTFVVVNLVGSVLLLVAIASLYHVGGTLDFVALTGQMKILPAAGVLTTATLLFVALALKLGLFPFHIWVPPVYADAQPAVAAILAGAVANIGSYGLLRFGAVLAEPLAIAATPIMLLGGASILYGGLLATTSNRRSTVLAYSSIGQAGYILAGIGLGGPAGFAAALIYAVANALDKTMLFLSAQPSGRLAGASFAIGALSVAGLPPSVGFIGKAALFQAAAEARNLPLIGVIIAGGALALGYMFRVYQHDRWRLPAQTAGSRVQSALVFTLALAIVAFGAWPEPLIVLSRAGAAILVRP